MTLSSIFHHSASKPQVSAQRPAAAQTERSGDHFDWSDPQDVFPAVGIALAGMSPLGPIMDGIYACDANTKGQRLEAAGAIGLYLAGAGMVVAGAAAPPLVAVGLAMIAGSGAMLSHVHHNN